MHVCKSVCGGRTSKNPLKNFRQKHHPATAIAVWNPRFSKVLWPSWHIPCEHMPRGQVRSRQRENHVKLIAKKNEGLGVFLWYFCDTWGLLEDHNFFKCQDGIFPSYKLKVDRYLSIFSSLESEIWRTNICKLTISHHLTTKEIPPAKRLNVLLEIDASWIWVPPISSV